MLNAHETPDDPAAEAATSAQNLPSRRPAADPSPQRTRDLSQLTDAELDKLDTEQDGQHARDAARASLTRVAARMLAIVEDPTQPGATAVGAGSLLIRMAGRG